MDEGFNTFSTARARAGVPSRTISAVRYFGGFIPWVVPRHRARRARSKAIGCPGIAATRKSDVPSTPTYRYFPATGGSITYNKTALWLNTMERWLGWPTLQKILATLFRAVAVQASEAAAISSTSRTKSRGRDIDWFFDEVYRSSNVFDYGVQDAEEHARPGHVPDHRGRAPLRRGDLSR